jgi:hypothetical protein
VPGEVKRETRRARSTSTKIPGPSCTGFGDNRLRALGPHSGSVEARCSAGQIHLHQNPVLRGFGGFRVSETVKSFRSSPTSRCPGRGGARDPTGKIHLHQYSRPILPRERKQVTSETRGALGQVHLHQNPILRSETETTGYEPSSPSARERQQVPEEVKRAVLQARLTSTRIPGPSCPGRENRLRAPILYRFW